MRWCMQQHAIFPALRLVSDVGIHSQSRPTSTGLRGEQPYEWMKLNLCIMESIQQSTDGIHTVWLLVTSAGFHSRVLLLYAVGVLK